MASTFASYFGLRSTVAHNAGVAAAAGSLYTVSSNIGPVWSNTLTVSSFSTLLGSTITVSTIRHQSTTIALGASTNQSYTNFTSGSYTTGWGSTLTGLTAVQKVAMSLSGQYQYAAQNGSSTINASVNSGVSWGTLTGANGLPAGATAYPLTTASGAPNYTSVSASATGQYVLASVRGGLLYTCANGTSSTPTFTAVGMGTPAYYLPLENSVADVVGSSAPSVNGSVTYTTGIVGTYAAVISNTAGGSASNYIRGTIPNMTAFTISGWINLQSIPGSGSITAITVLGGAGNYVAVSYFNNYTMNSIVYNGLMFFFYNTGSVPVVVGNFPNVSLNTWYSFTYIFSATGTCYAYVNNTLVGSVAGQTLLGTISAYGIGCGVTNTAQAFNGYIDDYRIYNGAVAFSPINPMNWAYTAVSGSGQYMLAVATGGGLFMSSNYGVTWTQVVNVGGWTGVAISYSGQYMIAVSTVGTYAPYYSVNYGVTWINSTFGGFTSAFVAISGNGQYSLTGFTTNPQLISNYLVGYTTTVYTVPTFSPAIAANINCASISNTGQYMVLLTQGTSNNVYYSTNYGVTFTALTVGSAAMTDCAISADGSYITVSNATTVYTLNRNTQGFGISIGNAAGAVNQGQNAIAIGNQAGVTNQSANSIILNSSGSTLDTYNAGFYVSNISDYNTSYAPSFSLLGYGSDKQIVQGGITLLSSGYVGIGTTNPINILQINDTSSAFSTPLTMFSPNLATSSSQYILFGKSASNYNQVQMGFQYVGAGSTSNYAFLQFYGTSNTICWTGNGTVGIGTTLPGYALHVIGAIYASGNITALSDQRYKQNIIRLSGSLDTISRLSGYSYIRTDESTGKRHIGLIAQEVNRVIPEAVSYDVANDTYSINYGCLIAPVIEAIKELHQSVHSRIAVLEATIERQERTIQDLKNA